MKIRIYRVEIAEIEMSLCKRDDIKEAIVTHWENRPGKPRSVAYVVPVRTPTPSLSTLGLAFSETLPDYLISLTFIMLDALPLTPTGKLDRQALPTPGTSRPRLETPHVGPRIPIERKLVAFWAEALGLESVGVHDNFLRLGGHSLLAAQILSRVLDTFRVDVPLRLLMEAPTIAEMAVVVVQHQAAQADPDTVARLLTEVESLSDDEATHRPLTDQS